MLLHRSAAALSGYAARRVAFAAATVLVAVSLNFALFRLLPGDAVTGLRCQSCTPQFQAAMRAELGLDEPAWRQYTIYVERLARGDLGTSLTTNEPVWTAIKRPLLNTLPMAALGTALAIVAGILLGAIAAWRAGRTSDRLATGAALLGYSAPAQWIGLLLSAYVAGAVGLPTSGIGDPELAILGDPSWTAVLADRVRHLILPALTLALGLCGSYVLLTRSALLDTLSEDYVLTARGKGLRDWGIVWRHGLPNAAVPLATMIALSAGYVVAGAIVVEQVFSYPGIGLATLDAIERRDWPVLQGIFLTLTVAVVLANLVVDLLYRRLDPRITR